MFELFPDSIEHDAKERLTAAGLDQEFLADTFSQVPKPFETLKTKCRQEKFFVQEFGMIVSLCMIETNTGFAIHLCFIPVHIYTHPICLC